MTTAPDDPPRADRSWALIVHDDPHGQNALIIAVRSVLGLTLDQAPGLRRLLPGVLRRGTHADLAPLLERLQNHGVWAELRPASEFPLVADATGGPEHPNPHRRITIPLHEGDFVPLAGHGLSFRWTDPKYHVLPAHDLNLIRPLTPAKARLVWDILACLLDTQAERLSPAWFEELHSFNAEDNPDAVRAWLSTHVPAGHDEMIVSWQPAAAVVTTAEIFCRYWDDFCYPASDDVTIWPRRDDWALVYHHEEQFFFARRKNVGAT